MDFVRAAAAKTGLPVQRLIGWLGVSPSKYHQWQRRYGRSNNHNACIPRDHWLTAAEKQAILGFHRLYPLEGYRRLAFMMLDRDVAAVSPASVYRVLKAAGVLRSWNRGPSRKGKGFEQPLAPHEHWHMDISYINIAGTFYYLCSVLDGASRFLVHWDLRPAMRECDVEVVLQAARERFPGTTPRIISDNGPQFIARDFKEFIRQCGMTHVRTSPYYPQSNGKLERYHRSLKEEAIRPGTPLNIEEAHRVVQGFVTHYNEVRLHSAIGYVTPRDRLEDRHEAIWNERDRKLEEARARRRAQHGVASSA